MNNSFEFDLNEATAVVWENVPENIREKFSFEDVHNVLKCEQEILDEMGINIPEGEAESALDIPIEIDWDLFKYEIISRAAKRNIYVTYDEIDEILDAELVYYEINGALGDAGEFLN